MLAFILSPPDLIRRVCSCSLHTNSAFQMPFCICWAFARVAARTMCSTISMHNHAYLNIILTCFLPVKPFFMIFLDLFWLRFRFILRDFCTWFPFFFFLIRSFIFSDLFSANILFYFLAGNFRTFLFVVWICFQGAVWALFLGYILGGTFALFPLHSAAIRLTCFSLFYSLCSDPFDMFFIILFTLQRSIWHVFNYSAHSAAFRLTCFSLCCLLCFYCFVLLHNIAFPRRPL